MAIATRCEQRALRRVSEERVFMSHGENIFGARIVASLGLLLCALILAQRIASQEQKSPRSTNAGQRLNTSNVEGKRVFESRCAGCHGLDGRGGERAPDIASNAKTQQRSDGELSRHRRARVAGNGDACFRLAWRQRQQCRRISARAPRQERIRKIARRSEERLGAILREGEVLGLSCDRRLGRLHCVGTYRVCGESFSQTKFVRQSSSRLVGTVWAEK